MNDNLNGTQDTSNEQNVNNSEDIDKNVEQNVNETKDANKNVKEDKQNTEEKIKDTEGATFYYGDSKYIDKYRNATAVPKKKKNLNFNIFSFIIFGGSVYALIKIFEFNYIAFGLAIFCFLWSIFGLSSRAFFYKLSALISFATVVIFGLFYLGILENSSEVLLQLHKDRFTTKVQDAVTRVKDDYVVLSSSGTKCYNFRAINVLYTKKLGKSPFGANYSTNSYIIVTKTGGEAKVNVCFTDDKHNGFNNVSESGLISDNVKVGDAYECNVPLSCR